MPRHEPKRDTRRFVLRRIGDPVPPPTGPPKVEWISLTPQPCFKPGCTNRATHLIAGVDLAACPDHAREFGPSHHRRIDREALIDHHARKVRDHLRDQERQDAWEW